MARLRTAVQLFVVLAAAGTFWTRQSVHTRRRTIQGADDVRSSPNEDGFAFSIKRRASPSAAVPLSETVVTFPPHASGAYRNRSASPPLHVHPLDDEEVLLLEGHLGYINNGVEGELREGGVLKLPAGQDHTFWNKNPAALLKQQVTIINRSGQHTPSERFFEQWAGIAYDYGGIDNVPPLQLLLTLKAGAMDLALPLPAQLLIRHIVCPFAELLGYRGFYPEYVLP